MYEQMQKGLPPIGSRVELREGRAKVVGHELLTRQLVVESEDHRRRLVPVADLAPPPNPPGDAQAEVNSTP